MVLAFPTLFLLETRLTPNQLHEIEKQIKSLTYDIQEAELVVGVVTTKKSASFELRKRGIWTDDVDIKEPVAVEDVIPIQTPPRKRRKLADNRSSGRESSIATTHSPGGMSPLPAVSAFSLLPPAAGQAAIRHDSIRVVRLAWLEDSIKAGILLPIDQNYLVYQGIPIPKPGQTSSTATRSPQADILTHGKAESTTTIPPTAGRNVGRPAKTRPTHLLHETTSEHDDPSHYPALPTYFEMPYSCFWRCPAVTPNDAFISHLQKIQRIRELQGGKKPSSVKSYGNSIAAIAAYPYTLRSPREVRRLPRCGKKVSQLFLDFVSTGTVKEADSLETDEKWRALNELYEIWGCAEGSAHKFWDLGYRSVDDVVERHWQYLKREQQIGVKFYAEFLLPIPRSEVESVANIVLGTANAMVDDAGFQMVIVGGYRRGKELSGDIDIMLSHPKEGATLGFIEPLVEELMGKDYITYSLGITKLNSERGQSPVSMQSEYSEATKRKHSFCSLDKAYVVWQDPEWPTKDADIALALTTGDKVLNSNPHRRVDIIISPWNTCGCAVAAWSSGKTLQRDLRSYVRKEKGLKFDSTGVRRVSDGSWVDLEGPVVSGEDGSKVVRGEKENMIEAEKRVFEGLGVQWMEPELRCTG